MGSGEKISWGSVIGGVITVLAVSLLLSTLGTSLGFSIVDPTSDDPINGAGTTVVIWSAVSIIISLAAGAFIAGRLAANDGLIHGFLVWATSLIVAAVLGDAGRVCREGDRQCAGRYRFDLRQLALRRRFSDWQRGIRIGGRRR